MPAVHEVSRMWLETSNIDAISTDTDLTFFFNEYCDS